MKKNNEFDEEIDGINKQIVTLKNLAWGLVGVGVVIFAYGVYYWIIDKNNYNEVGDFIGGVAGSLWALSGLLFIYVAFLGQKIEIKYQQEDLALTREELQETKEVFKQQAQIMNKQQLDSTFFSLLDNHRKVVDSFSERENKENSNELITGYEVLEAKMKHWEEIFARFSKFQRAKILTDLHILARIPLDLLLVDKHIKILFSEIKHLLDFINSNIESNNRAFYFLTLKNNLSENEKWLFEAFYYLSEKTIFQPKFEELNLNEYCNLTFMPPSIKLHDERVKAEISNEGHLSYEIYHFKSDKPTKAYIYDINNDDLFFSLKKGKEIDFVDIIKDFDFFNEKFLLETFERIKKEDAIEIFLILDYYDFKFCMPLRLTSSGFFKGQNIDIKRGKDVSQENLDTIP